jgi:hypothetical protein
MPDMGGTMRTSLIAVTAGVVGVVIGGVGWALARPDEHHDTAQSDRSRPAAHASAHYASAQDIADHLDKAGFTVSMLHKDTEASFITDAGGSVYAFTVTDRTGSAAGDSGINLFPNHKALTQWVGISQGFGGVAVAGDTWAISLPTTKKSARADSERLAPKIAKALGGTVAK